jgi:hypothetical protein
MSLAIGTRLGQHGLEIAAAPEVRDLATPVALRSRLRSA